MHFKTLVAMASATLALVACGGGGSVGLGGAGGAGSGNGNGNAESFIKGTVGGTVINATQNVFFTDGAANFRTISGTVAGGAPKVWSIQNLKAELGFHDCTNTGTDAFAIVLTDPLNFGINSILTTAVTGTCRVEVKTVTGDVIEGVFTATLVNAEGGSSTAVTNGSFKVPKAQP